MGDYSIETRRALVNAGWRPGRRVDITDLRHWLEASGFAVSEAATRFLSEFFGLVINGGRTPFEIDPFLAQGEDDRFEMWSQEIGETLTPIGEMENGHFFLGISASGEIYLVINWLASFGSGRQALENLIQGVRPIEVA